MKSVAVFLALVFLTGFQAAVLSEEPPPSILEPNQSVLEKFQDQLGKFSNHVTNSVNGGLEVIKERASDLLTYTTDAGKKLTSPKLMNRKLHVLLKEVQGYGQTFYAQGKEMMKDHLKKAADAVEEIKNHPTTVMMNEEMIQPIVNKCSKALNWLGEQSIASMSNMMQKKFNWIPTAP